MLKVQNNEKVDFSPTESSSGSVAKEDRSSQDFSNRYLESTQETLVGLYAQRDSGDGQPVEDINGIIHRVATSVAIAELKYKLSPEEIVKLSM